MEDFKRDYLMKTLSRTKRKDFENYVIHAIWHKLDRDDIQPTTQQYIRLSDGKYALLDLFFPQLNIGIECDESYHIPNQKNDQLRELKIEEVLSAYDETKDFELYRVRAYENLDAINNQIQAIVTAIIDKINKVSPTPWQGNENPIELAKSKGSILVADRLEFRTITDICECFGKNLKYNRRCYLPIGNGYQIWCPTLAIQKDGVESSVVNGWVNRLSDDWDAIWETNDDKRYVNENCPQVNIEKPRIVFARSRNPLGFNRYRFIGIFKIDQKKSNKKGTYFARIAKSIDLKPFFSCENQSKYGIDPSIKAYFDK